MLAMFVLLWSLLFAQATPSVMCLYGQMWTEGTQTRFHVEQVAEAVTLVQDGVFVIGCPYRPDLIGAMRVPEDAAPASETK